MDTNRDFYESLKNLFLSQFKFIEIKQQLKI